jgi:hypothetical protein
VILHNLTAPNTRNILGKTQDYDIMERFWGNTQIL